MEKFAPLAQNFTLLPAVTAATNLTSVVTTTSHLFINSVKECGRQKARLRVLKLNHSPYKGVFVNTSSSIGDGTPKNMTLS